MAKGIAVPLCQTGLPGRLRPRAWPVHHALDNAPVTFRDWQGIAVVEDAISSSLHKVSGTIFSLVSEKGFRVIGDPPSDFAVFKTVFPSLLIVLKAGADFCGLASSHEV